MKEGDYVRTKDYGFIKVKSFCHDEDMIHILDENYNEYDFSKELVDELKTSPNIIDLIEVGDYVNGYEVTSKDQFLGFGNHDWYMTNDEIKSIVTKEQFKSIEYEVK